MSSPSETNVSLTASETDVSLQPNFQPNSPGSSSLSTVESGGLTFLSDQSDQNKSKDNECLDCCKLASVSLFYLGIFGMCLGLIGCVISYYVFGIKFLVKDYQTSQECHSDVGDFVMASLIASFCLGSGQAKANKGDDAGAKMCINVVLSLFWLGWGIWGFITTDEEDCEDLEDSKLVEYSNVISIFFMVVGGLTISICLAVTVGIICIIKK